MQKLFLASVAANTIDKLAEILPKAPAELSVGFVPTAADPYEDKWFINKDIEAFQRKGFTVRQIDLKKKTKEKLSREFEGVDILCVGGGNTFYLLEKVRESGFDVLIKELVAKDVIYVGSSAGSILVCPTIEPIKLLDDPSQAPDLQSFNGLNLVDFIVLPHYGRKEELEAYNTIMHECEKIKLGVIPLTDNQAVIVEGNNYKTIG